MEPRCSSCRYFEALTAKTLGLGGWCHRYPPTVASDDQDDPNWGRCVVVEADWWCGEFVPAPSALKSPEAAEALAR